MATASATAPTATSALDANATNSTEAEASEEHMHLHVVYTTFEVLVAVMAVVGNALVIIVFHRERRLRRRTNYYIVSLAAADLLVGLLGIPFAIMASVGLPRNLYACLFTVSLLVVLCTISIFCLLAVSVDRYWAILHPMGYSRNVRTKTAIGIIGCCWLAGSVVGFLPLAGWHKNMEDGRCLFTKVMHYNYLVFLYFATIVVPALLLAASYLHIYQVVLKQLRQIRTISPGRGGGGGAANGAGGGTMLRVLGPIQKREVKATQNLSIIVLFFIVCWFPLYTINCVQAFCSTCTVHPTAMEFCIVLSHLNSAGNPLLYAYHLRDFRAALKAFLWGLLGVKDEGGGPGGGVGGAGAAAGGYGPGAGAAGSRHNSVHSMVAAGVGARASPWGGPGAGSPAHARVHVTRTLSSLHFVLAPPRAGAGASLGPGVGGSDRSAATTAYSSMTSIVSSLGSVHQAAAVPALAATAAAAAAAAAASATSPHEIVVSCEEVTMEPAGTARPKMSTLAEASQSEEDPASSPGAGPAAATPPSPPPPQLPRAAVARFSIGGDFDDDYDDDDDVFVPTSATNQVLIQALRDLPLAAGGGCARRASAGSSPSRSPPPSPPSWLRPARCSSFAVAAHCRLHSPCRIVVQAEVLSAADADADAGEDADADAVLQDECVDERTRLSPRRGPSPVAAAFPASKLAPAPAAATLRSPLRALLTAGAGAGVGGRWRDLGSSPLAARLRNGSVPQRAGTEELEEVTEAARA